MGERLVAGRLAVNKRGLVVDLALMATIALVLLQPGGPVRKPVQQWLSATAQQKALAENWPALVNETTPYALSPGVIEIVEAIDYECPFCRATAEETQGALRRSSHGMSVLHFPLAFHRSARTGARYAICAAEQGAFEQAHWYLLTTESWMTGEPPNVVAEGIGITEPDSFLACLDSNQVDEILDSHARLARSIGVEGTPSFASRHTLIQGAEGLGELERLGRADP